MVAYERELATLPTLTALRNLELTDRPRIVLVDNSESRSNQSQIDRELFDYLWMGGNVGISKALNAGFETLASHVDRILILDQDTSGVSEYIKGVSKHLSSGHDLIMPVVRDENSILSPCRRVGPWFRPLRSLKTEPRRISCINSGLIVSTALFRRLKFDETLFLDYVDHQFVDDAISAGATYEVAWDCELQQDYSRRTDSRAQAEFRFRIFRSDVWHFYSRRGQHLFGLALILHRGLVATIKYRRPSFLASSVTFWRDR